MKRAWPYALALAVVVTGCYLALAPLLRSLSPAPASTANRLSQNQNDNVQTVGISKSFAIVSPNHGSQSFVGLATTKKKAKKVKKPTSTTSDPTTNTPSPSTSTTGFANNPPSSSGNSSTTQAPKSTATTSKSTAKPSADKTASKKTGSASVGGGIDQSQEGSGFAGQSHDGSVVGGQTLAPGN